MSCRHTRTAVAIAAAACLGGCAATTSPGYDTRFGDGVRQLQAQQLRDADAPQRNAGVTPRADGRTVRDAVDRHGESYRITLGVPGSSSGAR
jgi:hypothetical protein